MLLLCRRHCKWVAHVNLSINGDDDDDDDDGKGFFQWVASPRPCLEFSLPRLHGPRALCLCLASVKDIAALPRLCLDLWGSASASTKLSWAVSPSLAMSQKFSKVCTNYEDISENDQQRKWPSQEHVAIEACAEVIWSMTKWDNNKCTSTRRLNTDNS